MKMFDTLGKIARNEIVKNAIVDNHIFEDTVFDNIALDWKFKTIDSEIIQNNFLKKIIKIFQSYLFGLFYIFFVLKFK